MQTAIAEAAQGLPRFESEPDTQILKPRALPRFPSVADGAVVAAASAAAEAGRARFTPVLMGEPLPTPARIVVEGSFDPELEGPLALHEAFAQPVLVLGRTVPLWALLGVLFVLGVVVARVTARRSDGAASSSRAPTPVAALHEGAHTSALSEGASDAEESESPKALLSRASLGDQESMKKVEARLADGYLAEEAVALSDGKLARERQRLEELAGRLRTDPPLIEDVAIRKQLRSYAADPDFARPALAAMAALPGRVGPDLLYDVWTGTAMRTAITGLAQDLLYTRDVRAKASPELSVALDLRAAETCEENKAVLSRAVKDGDRRSLHLLRTLVRRSGCGPSKRDDCFDCLRGDRSLEAALLAVQDRPRPTY